MVAVSRASRVARNLAHVVRFHVHKLPLSNVEARLEAIGMTRDRIDSIKAQLSSSGESVGSVELDANGLSQLGFSF